METNAFLHSLWVFVIGHLNDAGTISQQPIGRLSCTVKQPQRTLQVVLLAVIIGRSLSHFYTNCFVRLVHFPVRCDQASPWSLSLQPPLCLWECLYKPCGMVLQHMAPVNSMSHPILLFSSNLLQFDMCFIQSL